MAIVRAKVFVGENLGNPWFFSSKISYVTLESRCFFVATVL